MILIFSAHPDDAEFSMGGTLLKLARKTDVVNVVLTRGEAGTYGTPEGREAEAKEAGTRGGYRVRFLNFIDNHIEDTVENVKRLASVIREEKPEVIFTTYHTHNSTHTDGRAHPDHAALGTLTRKAARIAKFRNAEVEGEEHLARRIIYYMVPKYAKPTFVIDVTDVADDLEHLWRAHESQTNLRGGKVVDYLLEWRRHTGMLHGVPYAEEFIVEEPLVLDVSEFLSED